MASRGSNAGKAWTDILKQVYAEETDCYRCGQPVDKTLQDRIPQPNGRYRRNPQAKTGDHIWPYNTHPHLRLVRENVRLSHLGCNIAAGDKHPPPTPTTPQW